MSTYFTSVTAKVVAVAVVLVMLIAVAPITPAFAQEVSLFENIALAKSRVWGEYPKVDQAYPELAAPVVAPIKVETQVQAAAPVVEKTIVKIQTTETTKVPDATVEGAQVISAAAPVETVPATVESTGDVWIDEIVRLTNEARATEGLSPLKINATLNQAAAIRVAELPSSPSPHLRPDGAAFYTVFKDVGISPKKGGENYAIGSAGAYSPDAIVKAWMNSPSHRKNIMNANYKEIGIGHAVNGNLEYFEQLFIG